ITTAYSAVASSGGAKDTIVLGLDPDTTSSYEFDDALDLVEGVHLVGGYTAETDDNANYTDWTFSGTATPLTRNWVVVDERVGVMTATDISDETVLANFDLISSDPPIGPAAAGEDGTNVYGLIATDASGLHLIGWSFPWGMRQTVVREKPTGKTVPPDRTPSRTLAPIKTASLHRVPRSEQAGGRKSSRDSDFNLLAQAEETPPMRRGWTRSTVATSMAMLGGCSLSETTITGC